MKTQTEAIQDIENLRKRAEITNISITNRIEGVEESQRSERRHEYFVKDNAKSKKFLIQNIQEICDTMRKIKLNNKNSNKIRCPEQRPLKYLKQNPRRKFPQHRKEMSIKVQEAFRI